MLTNEQIDEARNLLLLSGTQRDIDSFIRLVNVFDVDGLNGMSFGLFPLKQGSAASVARELTTIMSSASGGSGAVRVIPIERINSILLIAVPLVRVARRATVTEGREIRPHDVSLRIDGRQSAGRSTSSPRGETGGSSCAAAVAVARAVR